MYSRTLKNNPGVCPSLSWAKLWGLSNLRAPSMVWEGVKRSLIILHHHITLIWSVIYRRNCQLLFVVGMKIYSCL